MDTFLKILLILITVNTIEIGAQNYNGTFYSETLDPSIKNKVDKFLKDNYTNHFNNFYLHLCKVFQNEDTVWYGLNGKENFYLQKYLFVYTFSDSLLGIDKYLINISFDLRFNVTRFNFPLNSRYKNLNFSTKRDIIRESFKYRPNYNDSIDYLKVEIAFDIEKDCLHWEVCLEKEKNTFDCLKFDAVDKKLIEEYSKVCAYDIFWTK